MDQKRAERLAEVLATATLNFMAKEPDLTGFEILNANECLRHNVTESIMLGQRREFNRK